MFNVDCSFASDSASAMRSSTLPTRFNSFASGVSVVAMVDILKGFVLNFCAHCRSRDSNMGKGYKQSFQENFSARSLGRHGLRTLFEQSGGLHYPQIDNLKVLRK